MTEGEMRTIHREMKKLEKGKYMIATKAIHLMGDLSRSPDGGAENLCWISNEFGDYWIGAWVTGFGFFHVLYPKETTRELTKEEVEKYNKLYVQLSNHPPQKLNIDQQ